MAALSCVYDRGGVFLPALNLWLDSPKARRGHERVFVSHAHSDHIAAHREVILTAPTSRLMRSRLPGRRHEHILAWNTPLPFSDGPIPWTITLFPAGHILGSAMARIEAAGESLLYTGDFKTRSSLAAETCAPVPANTLIMESTFGRPEYVFPPTRTVVASMIRFCEESLTAGITPVLLGYSLGKSQEILAALADTRLSIALHPAAAKLARIYEDFGVRFPPYAVLHRESPCPDHVLVVPPGTRLEKVAPHASSLRSAVLTGWAIRESCRFRYRADAAFPLSDHADFPDLLDFVDRVKPKEVLTLHGFASDLAQTLRNRGYSARSLSEPDQLELNLAAKVSEGSTTRS